MPLPGLLEDAVEKLKDGAARIGDARSDKQGRINLLKIGGSVVALLVAAVLLAYQIFGGPPSIAKETRTRDLIDTETREVFLAFSIEDNTKAPWLNPKTGKATLVPAERCFWTKDRKATLRPTFVLLNEYINQKGPTPCPDCGRPVVIHNPTPPAELMAEAAQKGN
ncbi:MAG: hypothetical protein ACT4PL_10945 [Phycisphaerales bacterium]